jgi:uncharacterized protein
MTPNLLIPEIRYLVMMLTNRCNLHCRYCYCPEVKTECDMNIAIMKQAIDIAASHGKKFHIQMAGGEPCLNREILFKTVQYARTTAPQATIAIQTNATLVDTILANFFKENHLQVGVSIDGPPLIHNKVRGNFNEMLTGLEYLEKYSVPWRATTVVTSDSIEHLWRLAVLLSRFRMVKGMGLDFLTIKNSAKKNNVLPPTSQAVENGIQHLLATLDMINKISCPSISFREAETVERCLSNDKETPFCNVCTGQSMAVYPDGSIYPCSQLAGEEIFYVGNVMQEINWSRLKHSLPSLTFNDCINCEIKNRCPGDCPSRLFYNDNTVKQNICAMYQTIYAYKKKETVI